MKDPFEILEQHIRKSGGLDNLKKQESVYIEGTFEIEGSGLSGTYKEWKKFTPDRFYSKIDIDLGVLRDIIGYTGNSIWKQDNHGKVTNITTDELLSEYRIKGLMEKYEFVNPESEYFKVSFQNENEHYLLTIQNSLNEDVIKYYINRSTLLLDKKIDIKMDETNINIYNDYRLVNNIMVPFKLRIESPESDQKQNISILNYDFGHLSESVFDIPVEDSIDFEFLKGSEAENISFEFLGGHIYLNASVNGKKGKFVLDSGAEKSLLDDQFCKILGLEQKGIIKGHGGGADSVDLSFAVCKNISVDGITLHNQTLLTWDLSKIFKASTGIEVAGLFGFDLMSRFITKIDFAGQLISFYDPKDFKYAGNGTIIKFELSGNLVRIPLTIDNKHTGFFRVDTGAGGISFHYPFAKDNDFDKKQGFIGIARGIGGLTKFKIARFNEIGIGGFTIDNSLISFPIESQTKSAFSVKSIIGNLGTDIMRHFTVFFDYKNNQLILEKGENFNKSFPENHSGVQINLNDTDEVFVKFISPESPAEKSGLMQDDILLKINGKSVSEFSNLIELKNCFNHPPYSDIILTVKRDNKTHEIKLKPEKLI